MEQNKLWVADCHIINKEKTKEYDCLAVAIADSESSYIKTLLEFLSLENLVLLNTYKCLSMEEFLKKYQNPYELIRISKLVNTNNQVVLGEPRNVNEIVYSEENLFEIKEYPYVQNENMDDPFFEKQWIDEDLKSILFSSTDDMNTYFIVDPALRRKVVGFFDLDSVDVPIEPLYKGALTSDMKEVAPYLIDMTISKDQKNISMFHKTFFRDHMDKNTGIFICSSLSMPDMVNHLRKFNKIKCTNGKWYYFRFWEPGLLKLLIDVHYQLASSMIRPEMKVIYEDEGVIFEIQNHNKNIVNVPTFSEEEIKKISGISVNRKFHLMREQIKREFPEYVDDLSDKELLDAIKESFYYADTYKIRKGENIALFIIMSVATVRGFHKEKEIMELFNQKQSGDQALMDLCDVLNFQIKSLKRKT